MGTTEYSTADSVYNAMETIRVALSGRYMINREFIMPYPVLDAGEYQMVLVSPLLDNKRNEVGTVRVFVFAPESGTGSLLARIEWTIEAFGFWFREDGIYKSDGEGWMVDKQWVRKVLDSVSHTANRNIPLKSQIRMHKKIKRNAVKDKAMRSGLVMG